MAVLQFVPHGNAPHGYCGPILDLHERPLVPARYVSVDDPQCDRVLMPGEFISCHEIRDRHFLEWARVNPDFRKVNDSPHPEASLWKR